MRRQRTAWVFCTGGAVAIASLLWLRLGPLPDQLLDDRSQVSTTVVDRHGVVLYEARSEDGTRLARLEPNAPPPHLVSATIAAEDRRFFEHFGVDLLAIGRATIRNARAGSVVEGGSTITQQVAKLLLARRGSADGARQTRTRGFSVKLQEAVIAIRLEHRFTKQEILALYLNLAPYGNQIVGAERASRAYFGCRASEVTVAQAAFLAGLPQRPSAFNPFRDRRRALARQKRVLERMVAIGSLSSSAADEARSERLAFVSEDSSLLAPHFVEMVLSSVRSVRLPPSLKLRRTAEALAEAGQPDLDERRPVRVVTTLDAELQGDIEGIIRSHGANLERHRAHNVAVVVLDNATGEWLAWEGSGNYFDADHGGAINGPLALRQPGSALKPFTYALAFEEGRSPATVLPDIPSHFPTAEPGVVYSPRNYDGQYRGPLLIRQALAGSENVPAVAVASEIGVAKLVRFLRSAGLTTFDKAALYYGLGVTLGNAEVQLAELVTAYSAFPREGLRTESRAIRTLTYGDGREAAWTGATVTPTRLVSSRTAFWITDILSDPDAREYVFGRGGSLDFPFPVAVKTGTSQAYHDNWTIGYTREVTVGVWVGNFNRKSLTNSSGVTGAGPIFHAVMLAAQRRVVGHLLEPDAPLAAAPSNVGRHAICALSGMRANAWCPLRTTEWLPAEDQGLPCSWHHQSDEGLLVVWPPAYRQWAAQHGLLDDWQARQLARVKETEDAGRTASRRTRPDPARQFEIVNPPPGAIYLIDPTLRSEYQTLPLRALADREARQIEWAVDGRTVGKSGPDTPLSWPLVPGEHQIAARDPRGRVAETTILVK